MDTAKRMALECVSNIDTDKRMAHSRVNHNMESMAVDNTVHTKVRSMVHTDIRSMVRMRVRSKVRMKVHSKARTAIRNSVLVDYNHHSNVRLGDRCVCIRG